jgi:dihydroxyacetone kinase
MVNRSTKLSNSQPKPPERHGRNDPLVPLQVRADYLGERSAGHQDPGATSSFLILKAAADTWKDIAV